MRLFVTKIYGLVSFLSLGHDFLITQNDSIVTFFSLDYDLIIYN